MTKRHHGDPHDASGLWVPHGMHHDSRESQIDLLQRLHCNQFATKPVILPQWLQTFAHNVHGAWHIATRMGIPETSVFNKCPLHAPPKPGETAPVLISKKVSAVLRAQESGVLYRADAVPGYAAHSPKFFMKWTPGVCAVIGSNVLVWIALFNI
mmetsp:Transcript_34569/g.97957  ORF Transcript_34569/g.97957 Transcript_34569/m.97957 type:complete len:154 (-) Transcript_34569:296-757(-)|eukprot:CAMPEP_0117691932 /NCGR_PEP_ID=MMETSP0804-20121206/26025_1 /TAXON_ID=1074897 /ORGANISM="Tetraselmis astigmatica, Strain CCMP880" /LENGTH=153 /DNA_ID=CAMNT_0005505281 /DNA_START=353 /DNA_END=814 /DNA_ORIENTATION=+